MTEAELIEALAEKEHESWARWMDYLFDCCEQRFDGSMIIPAEAVMHWERQIKTLYADLSEREKEMDRREVALITPIIRAYKEA